MEERKLITIAGLVQDILKLEDNETLHFKRSCDLFGWGIKKLSVFNAPFILLVDYSTGIGYPESLPVNYLSTDFVKKFIETSLSRVPSCKMAFYLISEEEANAMAFLYEEPVMAETPISFMQFAEKILELKSNETIDFYMEKEKSHAWAVQKIRLFDTDIIIFGVYGGGDTYLYDLTGDDNSPEELGAFLTHCLKCHSLDGVYLQLNQHQQNQKRTIALKQGTLQTHEKTLTIERLAEIAYGMETGEEIYFKTSPDCDLYGIALERKFEATYLYISYFGGNHMSILDVSTDSDVSAILKWLTEFLEEPVDYLLYPLSRDELYSTNELKHEEQQTIK